LSYFDSLALNIRAPNLKYLCLEGEFTDICLENTPLLVAMSVAMYMNDEMAECFEQSSKCNFIKFLGGVPRLERLAGHIYFTKVTPCHILIWCMNLQCSLSLLLCFGK
jgi:hypothetical protein